MKIQVHIERLVLEGLPVTSREGPRVQAAVEAELGRLLGATGLRGELRSGGALPALSGHPLRLMRSQHPSLLGQQIARSVHGGIGGAK